MTEFEYIGNIAVSAFCFVIVLLLYGAVLAQGGRRRRTIYYKRVALSVFLTCLLDIGYISVFYHSLDAISGTDISLMYLFRLLEFWFLAFTGVSWYLYSAVVCNFARPTSNVQKMLFYFPIAVYGILLATTLWTHLVIRIESSGEFVKGPLYLLVYFMPFVYGLTSAFTGLFKGIVRKYDIKREMYFMCAALIVPPIVSGILEYNYRTIPFVQMGATVSLLFVFFTVQNTRITEDQLTHIDNRSKMVSRLETEMKRNKKNRSKATLTLLIFDIDFFKEINMLFGHKEGDGLIIQVANILKKACAERSNFIVGRYGGDEFIVIGQTENPDQVTEFCSSIDEQVQAMNTKEKREYTVSLSAGFAVYKDSYNDVQDFITVAERSLEEMQNLKKRLN